MMKAICATTVKENTMCPFNLGDCVRVIHPSNLAYSGKTGIITDISISNYYTVDFDGGLYSRGYKKYSLKWISHIGLGKRIPRYTIYALLDPRNRVIRYVGYSSNVMQRYKYHIGLFDNLNNNHSWITFLRKQSLVPILSVLDYACTERDAWNCEKYWIYQLAFNGEPLLNKEVNKVLPDTLSNLVTTYAMLRQKRFEVA